MTKHRKRREREPAPPPPPPRSGPSPVLAACACFALALALYWGALRNPLVFDDRLLREEFLRLYAASWFQFDLRWLSHATFGWGYGIFRMDWFWHRLVNVLLHAATAVTLFVFLARLFRTVLPAPGGAARQGTLDPAWIAFFGALLFLFALVLQFSVRLSRMTHRHRTLGQRLALLEAEVLRLKQKQADADSTGRSAAAKKRDEAAKKRDEVA